MPLICPRCGETNAQRSPRCSRCGIGLSSLSEGLGATASALVILTVVMILVLGTVVLWQRENAIAAQRTNAAAATQVPSASTQPISSATDVPGTYIVQAGDQLFDIAARHGVTVEALRFWNAETYPSLADIPEVVPGWVLEITGPPPPSASPSPELAPPVQVAGVPTLDESYFPVSGGSTLTVTFYQVSGDTPLAILQSMEANGPRVTWTGGTAQAAVGTQVGYAFEFVESPGGVCEVETDAGSAPIWFRYRVTLPAWAPAGEPPPDTVTWWSSELTTIAVHERHHVEIYESYLPALTAAVDQGSCDTLTDEIASILEEARTENCLFDLEEYGYEYGLTLEDCLAA